jgi:hypothetical protein
MRKLMLVILVALAPSIAFARGGHGGGGHGGGGHGGVLGGGLHGGGLHGGGFHGGFRRFGGFGGYGGYPVYASTCWRYVRTYHGPRRVWVCGDYGYY